VLTQLDEIWKKALFFFKLEDDLNILKMEEDLNFLGKGGHQFVENGKLPQFFLKMEEDLILNKIKKGKGIKVKNVIELSHILGVDLEIGPNKLTVVGVYGTSSHDDPDFFINLRRHLTNIDNEEVGVLGDFNTTL
jgi:hypothetical protein